MKWISSIVTRYRTVYFRLLYIDSEKPRARSRSSVYYNWYFQHTDIRCITRYSNKIITYIVDKEGKIELVIFVKDEHLIRLWINKTQSNEMVLMIKINKENRTIVKCLLRGLNSRPLVNILMLRDRRSTTELRMLLLHEPGHW